MSTIDHDELHDMLQDIDYDGEGLTAWEVDFVGDLIDRDQRYFTARQAQIIKRIYSQRVG